MKVKDLSKNDISIAIADISNNLESLKEQKEFISEDYKKDFEKEIIRLKKLLNYYMKLEVKNNG